MAGQQRNTPKASAQPEVPAPAAPVTPEPVEPETPAPAEDQAPDPEAAAVEGSDTTTDYTRRAGGYVLTDRGWQLEQLATDEQESE